MYKNQVLVLSLRVSVSILMCSFVQVWHCRIRQHFVAITEGHLGRRNVTCQELQPNRSNVVILIDVIAVISASYGHQCS